MYVMVLKCVCLDLTGFRLCLLDGWRFCSWLTIVCMEFRCSLSNIIENCWLLLFFMIIIILCMCLWQFSTCHQWWSHCAQSLSHLQCLEKSYLPAPVYAFNIGNNTEMNLTRWYNIKSMLSEENTGGKKESEL